MTTMQRSRLGEHDQRRPEERAESALAQDEPRRDAASGARVPHIRVIDSRTSRRLGARPGQSHNLCGAAPTDLDWIYADAKRSGADALADRHVCAACIEQLPAVLAPARRRA